MPATTEHPEWMLNPLGLDRYRFTPAMSEISGFGGTYEAGCRAMVQAAMVWFEDHPDADPEFMGYERVYGIVSEQNEEAESLTEAMMDAEIEFPEGDDERLESFAGKTVRVGDEATGAMHQAAVQHAFYAHKEGWDAYVEALEEAKAEREEAEDAAAD